MSSTDIGPEMLKAEWENKFWKKNFLPFHIEEPDARLVEFYDSTYGTKPSKRIFIPLCGKTLDLIWLEDKGHEVVGLEFCETAINDFFAENNLDYERIREGKFEIYKSKSRNITIFQGNILDASVEILGKFDAIWDKASSTTMYPIGNQRTRYLQLMRSIARSKELVYLMIVLEHDFSHKWPPYSIDCETLTKACEEFFEIKELCRNDDTYPDPYNFLTGPIQDVVYELKIKNLI